jgi:NAD(P)-dependent dehydrogenase (short-subunit alcohol dehydrogenase family)
MTTQATPVPARPAPPPVARFILVTGASGGIGRATAARLADAGHLVFAGAGRAGSSRPSLPLSTRVRPVVLDVTDQASIDHARHQIDTDTDGYGLDVLVNATGILALGPVEAVPDPRPGPSWTSTCSTPSPSPVPSRPRCATDAPATSPPSSGLTDGRNP